MAELIIGHNNKLLALKIDADLGALLHDMLQRKDADSKEWSLQVHLPKNYHTQD